MKQEDNKITFFMDWRWCHTKFRLALFITIPIQNLEERVEHLGMVVFQ